MTTIVTRTGKGSSLSWIEADANFTNLNTDKLENSNNLSDLTDTAAAKTNLSINNVDNTSDVNKPVSTAQQTAINSSITTHVAGSDPHTQYLQESAAAASTGASLVGYTRGVTGATTRTVESVLYETVSVKDFGAVGDGVTNDTAAFVSALATGKKIFLPNGSYYITTLTITGRTEIQGESRDGAIIQGDGDLIYLSTINSSLHLSDLTLQNVTTRGVLVKVTYGSDLLESSFSRIHFKKAQYHIDTNRGFGPSIVDWRLSECRFIDASIVSRIYGAIWASTEDQCYTWFCNKGIQFNGNIATVRITNSVFELNGLEAIFVNLTTNATLRGLEFDSVHFEANGQTIATSDIVLNGDPATAIIENLTFINCGSFAATASPTISIPTPTNIPIFNNLSFVGCKDFTISAPANGSRWSSIEYRNDFQIKSLSGPSRLLGVVGGNNVVQVASISIAVGEAHRVQAYTGNSGAGAVNVYQEYIVSRSVVGNISVATVADIAGGGAYGVVIVAGAGVYTIQNKPAMANTYQPYIIVDKL